LITLKVESDTAQLLLDNHGASKQINFTFKDNGTDKWIIYKTTDNIFNIYDASSAQVIAQFNATSGLASDTAAMAVVPTISSANARAAGMRVVPSFTGAGDTPQGFFAAPTFAPSANLTTATGFLGLSVAAPGSGVTISTLIGLYGQCFFSDTAGAVTDSIAGRFAAPSMAGALKPTTSYGIFVDNMGAAGITNAIAARFAIPSGATNNWYLEFSAADDTDPTSGGGAATGRIKCLIGGNTRYIPYYT
jgi:hypothetical protein